MEYRDRMRPKVPRGYSSQGHLLCLLGTTTLGTLLPLGCWLSNASNSWAQFAIFVPCALVYANLAEYFIHRFGGHHTALRSSRIKPLKLFRFYHAVVHHTFFSDGDSFAAEEPEDLFFVLFPAWVYLGWLLCTAAPMAVLPLILWRGSDSSSGGGGGEWRSSGAVQLLLASASFSLLQYELLHTFHHQALTPSLQRWLERVPALRTMQRRHLRHHSGTRKGNYNITWPWSDYCFGTLL